jgi:anion-transporting  ArsA/GET3 family ATPase
MAPTPDLTDLRFVAVVGKGGVGKTTVAGALALKAAQRGKRVLIAMCNAEERLSAMLEVAPIGPRNQSILPNIDAVNMTPESALREYGMMILKVKALYHAVFENRIASALLHATPGIQAWAMLGKAYYHATELLPDGRSRYDLVILDAPATGHAVDMFRVPQVITRLGPSGLLRSEAEKALALFQDPSRSGFVLVTLTEEMPVTETLELYDTLRHEFHFPVRHWVVNSQLSPMFAQGDHARVDLLANDATLSPQLHAALTIAKRRALKEQEQHALLTRLQSALQDMPQGKRIELPHLWDEEFSRAQLQRLSDYFG